MKQEEKDKIKVLVVLESNLTELEKKSILRFNKECFSDVDPKEANEDFIAKSFARILTYENEEPVGTLRLFKRKATFENKDIVFGGTGGVCVTEKERGKGIATKMLQKGLEVLKSQGCDIACLNVDLKKTAYKVYERLGFKLMDREISFENSKGEIKYDTGTMFIPIRSRDVYDLVMNSKSTFHYGVGYW